VAFFCKNSGGYGENGVAFFCKNRWGCSHYEESCWEFEYGAFLAVQSQSWSDGDSGQDHQGCHGCWGCQS
jgi:hypothetical protein